jgi:glycosyltransferase involved in cell wall biosynthesis
VYTGACYRALSVPDQTRFSIAPPRLSVIIPIYAAEPNAVDLLRLSLRRLKASSFQDFEVIVADDGSPIGKAVRAVAGEDGAELVRLDRRRGPAAARNAAAAKAKAEILVFLDADTSLHPDTLDRLARKFQKETELDAVVGSDQEPTAQEPTAPGFVSRFRNLLPNYVRQCAKRRTGAFWAGCGAVRKGRFQALGGFDENVRRPLIEDVEFGSRLCQAGGRIEQDPEIQVTRHQSSLPSALGFSFNFSVVERISAVLTAATMLLTVIALLHGGAWWLLPPAGLAGIAVLNRRLFRFLARAGNWREALLCFPLLLAYFAASIAGLLGERVLAEHRRDRFLWPSVAVIGATLLAVQIAGGAYTAEFTGFSDESAHFVSGLMVYDYLASLPRGNPIEWAGQYYLHYPKVAIGHWPPGYYALEALWWLLLGPSRATSMLLQWAIGVAALTVFYRLARTSLSFPITAAIIAATIATPVFQQTLGQTMADLCCLLWSVLIMQAVVRLVERQDRTAALWLVVWLVAAGLTKGTVVCLLPLPIVALLASRQRIRIPLRWLAIAGAIILTPAAWYLWNGGIQAWGGILVGQPWPGKLIGHLAGWGCVGVAIFGLQRKPLALVAGSVVVCTLGVTFLVRAMREERHWIIVLPAILLLAGMGISRFRSPLAAGALAAIALVFFPYSWYRQSPAGYADLARQLHRPARVLVSSTLLGEGPFIAMASLGEKRPSSFMIRATKVLSKSGWNGEGYRLLTKTPAAILQRLDELGVDTVVLDSAPVRAPALHHALLQEAVDHNPAWRPCGSAQELTAYCRVSAPQFPRQPLRLNIYGWDFEERAPR